MPYVSFGNLSIQQINEPEQGSITIQESPRPVTDGISESGYDDRTVYRPTDDGITPGKAPASEGARIKPLGYTIRHHEHLVLHMLHKPAYALKDKRVTG